MTATALESGKTWFPKDLGGDKIQSSCAAEGIY